VLKDVPLPITIDDPGPHEWVTIEGVRRAREVVTRLRCCFRGTNADPPRSELNEGAEAQGVRSGGLQRQSPKRTRIAARRRVRRIDKSGVTPNETPVSC
jgi:hypothetical protein